MKQKTVKIKNKKNKKKPGLFVSLADRGLYLAKPREGMYEGQAPRLLRIRHGGMKRGYFHGESFERPGLTG